MHMWNLRNKTDEHGGKKEREAKHKTFLTIGKKLKVAGGEMGGGIG